MQNKPNFLRSQMNVNSLLTTDYENKSDWTLGQNKPNSNPIKANSNPIKANSKPIAERVKLMQSVYLERIKKKNTAKGYEKQSQNKPNSNPNKPNLVRRRRIPKGQNRLPKNPTTPKSPNCSRSTGQRNNHSYIFRGKLRSAVYHG